ncbi:MAG: hypothetical protein MSH10_01095 [Pygmaiobacter massiliensis]|nr:hypothetical protein [Pygmaiobacter massiliensis]
MRQLAFGFSFAAKKADKILPAPSVFWLCFAAIGVLLCALVWSTACAHPAAVGENQLKQDFLWTVGNARSFFLGFPPQDIRFTGVRLTYHYLQELLCAGLSAVSGVSCYDLLAFWLAPLWMLCCCTCLWRTARLLCFESRRAAAWVCILSVFAGGCGYLFSLFGQSRAFSSNLLYHLVTNVNACASALCYVCILVALVCLAARADWKVPFFQYVVTICAVLMLLVCKEPVGLLAVLALCAAAAVRFLQRKARPAELLFAVLCLGVAFFFYRLLFFAGANNIAVGFSGTLSKSDLADLLLLCEHAGRVWYYLAIVPLWILNSFLLSPAVVGPWLVVALRDLFRLGSLSAERLFLHAGAVGELLAYCLFDHYAMSQIYFFFFALWCMALLL